MDLDEYNLFRLHLIFLTQSRRLILVCCFFFGSSIERNSKSETITDRVRQQRQHRERPNLRHGPPRSACVSIRH